MLHQRDIAQGNLVVVDTCLLALAALGDLCDLLFDARHLAGGIRDDRILADGCALQVGNATGELANRRVRGVRIALVAQRRLLLVELLELEELELVGVRCFHASSPWVTR